MNKTTILSGNFTSAGNFSGYNLQNNFTSGHNRIHIPDRMMQSLGWEEDKDVKFPFYAIIGEREFEGRDADNQPTGVMFKRTQAIAVFKTKPELISASISDRVLDIEANVELQNSATSAGLSEKAVQSLVEASI